MGISRREQEKMAEEIRRIYERAELQIIVDVARRLKDGIETADWQAQKLAQLDSLRRDVEKTLDKPSKIAPGMIEEFIQTAYQNGGESVVEDLQAEIKRAKEQGKDPADIDEIKTAVFGDNPVPDDFNFQTDVTPETLMAINQEAVAALAGATTQAVTDRHLQIIRQTEDVYRNVIAEVVGSGVTGTETRLEVAQSAYNKFIERGIATFEAGNRSYDIATYTEMATRSAIGQAAIQGHLDQADEMDMDLQAVSDHPEECDLCRPWEGEVLSASGDSTEYPSLQEAMSDGLFHQRCGHRLHVYIPGLSKLPKHTEDEDGAEQREWQRYLERGVRKWKKREAGAMTDDERKKSKAKVAEWSNRIKAFTEENDRRRKRSREQLGAR